MYNNYEENRLSIRKYNLTIGLVLLWGFAVNAFMCMFFTDVFLTWNPVAILIGYFIVAIAGIFMSSTSDNPLISFIGYNLVVLPVGVVLSIFLKDYEQISIINAFLTTTALSFTMVILSILFPNIFLSLGRTLFCCLIIVLIVELAMLLFRITTPTILDFLVALLFCGYIGYDWAKAQEKDYTLDNAIDSVVDLYLDIINLFIRILSITGKSSKKD